MSAETRRRAVWTRSAAVAALAIGAGAGTAALVPLGRPQLPVPSAEWVLLAAAAAGVLLALLLVQAALLTLRPRRPLRAAVGAAAASFTPLLLLWPLLLGVTFWEPMHHLWVFHPGLGLWWGGAWFLFAAAQIVLLPLQLDGWTWRRPAPGPLLARLRRVDLGASHPLLTVAAAYTLLRLTVRFAFDTAEFIDPKRAYNLFYSLATLTDQGVYPYLGRWSEYPPGFPWLSTGVYRAVSFFGVTYDRYYAAITLAILPFGVGTLVLVYKLVERTWDKPRAVYAAWAFTALAVPMHDWMRTFSAVPIFFLLLAVWLAVDGRRHSAVLAAALGFLFKIVPIAALVPILRDSATLRRRAALLALTAVYLAAGLAPFWIAGRPWFEASLGNMLERPPWGTVWALLDGWHSAGVVNWYRLDPNTAIDYDFEGRLPDGFSLLPLLAFGALALWLALRRHPVEDARTQVRVAFLALLGLLLALKGWSPSFVNWVLPFLLVVYPNGRGVILAVALGALELFWRPLSLTLGVSELGVMLAVAVRTLVFLALGADQIRHIHRSHANRPLAPA